MYDGGNVAIVQGVGYPDPDHSHFRSTEIWQTGAAERLRVHRLARPLSRRRASCRKQNLFNAVALSNVLPEALISKSIDVPAIDALRGYGLQSDKRTGNREAFHEFVQRQDACRSARRISRTSPRSKITRSAARKSCRNSSRAISTQATYPATPLGRSLALAAQIVGTKLGTRVLYLQHGSFDTHVTQKADAGPSARRISRTRSPRSTKTSRRTATTSAC